MINPLEIARINLQTMQELMQACNNVSGLCVAAIYQTPQGYGVFSHDAMDSYQLVRLMRNIADNIEAQHTSKIIMP